MERVNLVDLGESVREECDGEERWGIFSLDLDSGTERDLSFERLQICG